MSTQSPTQAAAVTTEAVTPYMLGMMDAQDGMLCVPEMYFVRRSQMQAYAAGWEAIAGESLLSADTLGRKEEPVATDSREAELVELAASEGIKLALPVKLIVWFEEKGYVVNLVTGIATRPMVGVPTQKCKSVNWQ